MVQFKLLCSRAMTIPQRSPCFHLIGWFSVEHSHCQIWLKAAEAKRDSVPPALVAVYGCQRVRIEMFCFILSY